VTGDTFTLLRSRFAATPGDPVAFRWQHSNAAREPCSTDFAFHDVHANLVRPTVGVVDAEALTVVEELVCSKCGRRGWVREGEWIDE
jgi:hypothetical protein